MFKLFLLQAYVSESPPGIVMAFIGCECLLITLFGLIKVFISYVFMATEGVSIGKVGIELDGPVEEFESSLMLLL